MVSIKKSKLLSLSLCLLLVLCYGCKEDQKKPAEPSVPKTLTQVPAANADSLYSFVEQQLAFGHRIPGTEEHKNCKEFLVNKLKNYTPHVIVQEFEASFLDVSNAESYNIIASFNPEYKKRVIVAAHWDSRKIAEKEENKNLVDQPILGADDGGSGVAGVLEIARLLSQNDINMGIDLILFDAEDQGRKDVKNTYCLGSQYWSKNPHKRNYRAKFGILLDMIGSKGATFPIEAISAKFALNYVTKIWTLASVMGYSDYFINTKIGGIEDDHYYMNLAGIPSLDIINYDVNNKKFGHYHHTHADNIDIIDKNVLRIVTQVVLAGLYRESDNAL